jgi:hypothetical protein
MTLRTLSTTELAKVGKKALVKQSASASAIAATPGLSHFLKRTTMNIREQRQKRQQQQRQQKNSH